MTFLARILGAAGEPITRSSITDITYTVRDLTEATTTTTGQALEVAGVVFNDLQQGDFRWQRDSRRTPGEDGLWGYNFAATLAHTLFADYDVATTSPYEVTRHTYRVDFRFTAADGTVFVQPFEFTPIESYV